MSLALTNVIAVSLLAATACSPVPTETPGAITKGPLAVTFSPTVAGDTPASADSLQAFISEFPDREWATKFAKHLASVAAPIDIIAGGHPQLAARFNRIWRQRDRSAPEALANPSSFNAAPVTIFVDARAERNEVTAYRHQRGSFVIIRATDFSENAVSSGLIALAQVQLLARRHAQGGNMAVRPFAVEVGGVMPDSWHQYVGQLTTRIVQSPARRVTIAAVGKLP